MTSGDEFTIHTNPQTGCYEAWLIDMHSGEKRLLSTCSLCVSEDQLHWWSRQVWTACGDSLRLSSAA